MSTVTVDQLARNAELLANQIGHWGPERWRDRGTPVHELVQHIADVAADVTGRPKYQVPRLPDPALADQLRVIIAELASSGQVKRDLGPTMDEISTLRRTLV